MTRARVPLSEYVTEYSVRNKADEDIPVYSVTNSQGFCTEYFGKEVASKDKTTYKIVPRGYFAYNPSRINVGSIDWQRHEDRVIVSPLYNVFAVSDKMDKQYLYYFLRSDIGRQMIQAKAAGSVRDNLKIEMLKEMTVPDMTVDEQRRCAAVLDRLHGLIVLRQQQLASLDTLIKARFVELFGEPEANTKNWPVVNMADLCTVGSSKRIYQSEQSMDGVPFWRISDLTNLISTGMATAELFIPEERYMMLQAQKQVPVEGDILVTSRGTLGQCYIVRADDKFYFQDGMISWLSEYADGITPLYIAYLFSMPGFRKQIDSMQAGSTVAYLSIAMIRKLKVMLPDMETQNQFSAFVAQVDKSKAVVQKALDEAQTLFDSLMQQYFG